jgi:predicted DsbA family dithiol-disulfide isomerase
MEAERNGCFREVLDALFRAYFSDGLDIGRVDVLVEIGRREGMDPTEAKAALDVDLHRETVLEKRREAERAGVTRSPALVWLGRVLEGYPDDEKLTNFLAP